MEPVAVLKRKKDNDDSCVFCHESTVEKLTIATQKGKGHITHVLAKKEKQAQSDLTKEAVSRLED